jgi:glutaredoxin 3
VTVTRQLDDTAAGLADAGTTRPEHREPVLVYTLAGCLHCANARRRLRRNGIQFSELRVESLPGGRETLLERTGGWTAPQIVIGTRAIGGADALARLDRSGALGGLVRGQRFPRAVVRRRLAPGRILRWLLSAPFGGACGPHRISVDIVDERGSRLERRPAGTLVAAELLAASLNL